MSRMPLISDAAGIPRPDMDAREVPLATMAEYLGVSPDTLYRRLNRGDYDDRSGIIRPKSGGHRRFIPRLFMVPAEVRS